MQRHALEVQAPHWETLDEELLAPDVATRLGEIRAPTLVLVGDEDVDDMQALADRFTTEIPGARRATIAGAAHVPNLEQPARVFDALVLGFLAEASLACVSVSSESTSATVSRRRMSRASPSRTSTAAGRPTPL